MTSRVGQGAKSTEGTPALKAHVDERKRGGLEVYMTVSSVSTPFGIYYFYRVAVFDGRLPMVQGMLYVVHVKRLAAAIFPETSQLENIRPVKMRGGNGIWPNNVMFHICWPRSPPQCLGDVTAQKNSKQKFSEFGILH